MGKKLKSDFKRQKNRISFLAPIESSLCGIKIELLSNKEAAVSGCRGVIDYCDYTVKLKLLSGAVEFCGSDLRLLELADGSALIKGEIKTVEFL